MHVQLIRGRGNLAHPVYLLPCQSASYHARLHASCLCRLVSLSDSLGQLKHLQKLSCSHNAVARLPGVISRLTHLQHLDLRCNSIAELPQVRPFCWKHIRSCTRCVSPCCLARKTSRLDTHLLKSCSMGIATVHRQVLDTCLHDIAKAAICCSMASLVWN